jgi:hypothetical protein
MAPRLIPGIPATAGNTKTVLSPRSGYVITAKANIPKKPILPASLLTNPE